MHDYSNLKFCPKCASKLFLDKVDERKRKHCRRCGYILYRNPIPVANAVIIKDGKVLLIKRGIEPQKGYWALPGGYVEHDEHPKQSVEREVLEETGLRVKINDLVAVNYLPGIEERFIVPITYWGEIIGGEYKKNFEVSDLDFFEIDKLPEKIAWDYNIDAIKDWRKKYGR